MPVATPAEAAASGGGMAPGERDAVPLLQPGEQLIQTTDDAGEAVRLAENYRIILKKKARKNDHLRGWEVHTRNFRSSVRDDLNRRWIQYVYYAVIAVPPERR